MAADLQAVGLGWHQLTESRHGQEVGQPGEALGRAGEHTEVGCSPFVAGAGPDHPPDRRPDGRPTGHGRRLRLRDRHLDRRRDDTCARGPAVNHRHPVVDDHRLGAEVGGHGGRPEHAVRAGRGRPTQAVEAGYRRQRQLDGHVGEGPSHQPLVGVLDRDPQQGGRRLVRDGVVVVGAHELRPGEREGVAAAGHVAPDLLLQQRRLGLDVEAGQAEREGVAIAAEVVDADLQVLGRRLTADHADGHAVGAVVPEGDGVEAGHDVRVDVARAPDLVQELRGDRADVDPTARARVLRDDRRTVGRDLR